MQIKGKIKAETFKIRLGLVDCGRKSRREASIKVEIRKKECRTQNRTIDLQPITEYTELSVTFDIVNDSCGCGVSKLLDYFPDNEPLRNLCKLADKWHLNGMRGGCREQIDHLDRIDRAGWEHSFDGACSMLEMQGLRECNGYEYGSDWLVEDLPQDVEDEIRSLVAELQGNKS